MIAAKKKSNIFLILALFSAIAFYGYFISENKGSKEINTNEANQNSEVSNIEKGVTTFKDVEYKTTDAKNRDYITKGNEAKITKNKPDLIELKTVQSFTNLKDGTVLNVNSEKADYFKKTKNIKYYQNVVITNKNTVITSDIANYFAKKNLIRLEGNVIMQDPKNKIKGDIAELDTITNNLEVFMNKKEDKVYGRREQIKK
jgi:lipopolysaccharide export system protein LptA